MSAAERELLDFAADLRQRLRRLRRVAGEDGAGGLAGHLAAEVFPLLLARIESATTEPVDTGGDFVGATIRLLRAGRSQVECATVAGLPSSIWSLWESGRRQPSRATLPKILRGLGVSQLRFEAERAALLRDALLREATNEELADYVTMARSTLASADDGDTLRANVRRHLVELVPALESLFMALAASSRPAP